MTRNDITVAATNLTWALTAMGFAAVVVDADLGPDFEHISREIWILRERLRARLQDTPHDRDRRTDRSGRLER
jgi:hypothetical protein